ncbi:hypothetical protein HD806DRAFT_537689 [Xylariaceae sp. AK1471]|nr:hypothetical protein HD806DRAFT_537689 [Xylariaceae sp. AK1471]
MKSWPDALTMTLRLLCQHASLLDFQVNVFGNVGLQLTEALKILLEPHNAAVSICVLITELWHILLRVPDNWVKAIVPLLIGEDPDTRTAVWDLKVALSKSTGTFGRKTAIMVLLSLGHDIRAKCNYNGTLPHEDEPVTPFEIAVTYGRLEELTSCCQVYICQHPLGWLYLQF